MARLTELGKSGEWTYAGDVSPNQLCEKLAYYENLEEMSQKKKNQVTKVIKIGSCFDCPLSDVVDHGEVEGGVLRCESAVTSFKVNNTEICNFAEVSNDIPIPEWCPLEDADQSLTNVDNRRCVYRCEDCGNIFTEAENAENDDALCLNCSSLKHSLVEEVTLREVLEEISRRDRTNYEYEFAFEDCSTEDLRKIASLMGYKINSNEVLC